MMPGRTVDLIFYKEDFNMSIRKTMYVKENSFRKLDDPFNDVAKKYVFSMKQVGDMVARNILVIKMEILLVHLSLVFMIFIIKFQMVLFTPRLQHSDPWSY